MAGVVLDGKAASLVLRRFLAANGGSAAGLVWLRGTRERCGVVGYSALGAEEHDDEGAEAAVRAERSGQAFGGYHGKRRDGFSYGPTARQGDAWDDGCMRRSWSGRGGRLTTLVQGGSSGRAAVAHARRQRPGAV
jgi:hypothetical protein